MAVPYLSTSKLIAAVKRKINFPLSQETFTEDDIIDFLNEEMMISQVPSVLEFHENYFVYIVETPLLSKVKKYQIPNRAIGMKLNDLMYKDLNGNLYEMTRINDGDKAYFQANIGSNSVIHKFYLEGNYVVLTPDVENFPVGSLQFSIFLRPNQLVIDDRAATITSFIQKVQIVNASLNPGDTLTFLGQTFTAVSGAPSTNQFQIGGSSIVTATNLTNAINLNGTITANNGSPSTDTVSLQFTKKEDIFQRTINANITTDTSTIISSSNGIVVSSLFTTQFDTIPTNITNGSMIDFLQTNPGHQIYSYDIQLSNTAISGTTIDFTNTSFIPDNLIVGDYICSAHECIIPNLPPEVHNLLAERTCARILSAIGDQQGLAATMQHIQEMEGHQATLIDNRVENAPRKVLPRTTPLRLGKMGWRRRI